ncbi:MAG: nucleotidyltransferase domain-containing protein [Verrucomicrobiota bacterium]
MSPQHGLAAGTMGQIAGVLAHFPEVERAVLFGSRAKGTHKPGSDIDLSLVGEALDWRTVGKIYDALDDLLLPYRFSLMLFDRSIDPDVAAHIDRVGIPVFQRESVGVERVRN